MIKSKLFFKYLAYGLAFSIVFFILALLSAQWIQKDGLTDLPGQGQMKKILAEISPLPPQDRLVVLEESLGWSMGMRPFEVSLVNAEGVPLFPKNKSEKINIKAKNNASLFAFLFSSEDIKQIEKLPGEPVQYLVFRIDLDGNHPQLIKKRNNFFTMFGTLIGAMAIGIFISLFLVFKILRARVTHLDQVIFELRHGNLKARLPLGKMDEIGLMMSRFNQMADEIEKLVNSVKKAEDTRKSLLRELAHDLRTPIASLKNLLEISLEKKHLLSEEKKDELLKTAIDETDYFSNLVDDLPFLGQIQDPTYKNEIETLNINELLTDEIGKIKIRYPNIVVLHNISDDKISLEGDFKLFQRLFRNLLENSFSFAQSSVKFSIEKLNDHVVISAEDDGHGFSEEELKNFGQKKANRKLKKQTNRISIGLGSVIMKSIVETFNGTINASNVTNTTNEIRGAKVVCQIPSIKK